MNDSDSSDRKESDDFATRNQLFFSIRQKKEVLELNEITGTISQKYSTKDIISTQLPFFEKILGDQQRIYKEKVTKTDIKPVVVSEVIQEEDMPNTPPEKSKNLNENVSPGRKRAGLMTLLRKITIKKEKTIVGEDPQRMEDKKKVFKLKDKAVRKLSRGGFMNGLGNKDRAEEVGMMHMARQHLKSFEKNIGSLKEIFVEVGSHIANTILQFITCQKKAYSEERLKIMREKKVKFMRVKFIFAKNYFLRRA